MRSRSERSYKKNRYHWSLQQWEFRTDQRAQLEKHMNKWSHDNTVDFVWLLFYSFHLEEVEHKLFSKVKNHREKVTHRPWSNLYER